MIRWDQPVVVVVNDEIVFDELITPNILFMIAGTANILRKGRV